MPDNQGFTVHVLHFFSARPHRTSHAQITLHLLVKGGGDGGGVPENRREREHYTLTLTKTPKTFSPATCAVLV